MPSVLVIYEIASATDAVDLLQQEYGFMRANASRTRYRHGMQIRSMRFVKVRGLKGGGQQKFTGATVPILWRRRRQGRRNQIPGRDIDLAIAVSRREDVKEMA